MPESAGATFRSPADRDTITNDVRRLGRWFHNIDLGGVQTAPDHFLGDYPAVKWRHFAHAIERLLLEPARRWHEGRFIVAGPQYPEELVWPPNVAREIHVSPAGHREFYTAQRFTLNVTRADMVRAGWSPSVRLFEAAACGVPIITDVWPELDTFFTPGEEILVSRSPYDTLSLLRERQGTRQRTSTVRSQAFERDEGGGVVLVRERRAGSFPRRAVSTEASCRVDG